MRRNGYMKSNTSKMNKKQRAYEYIQSQILNGSYSPGHRIVIDRIAQELGSSSIPVREAIYQLEAEGLVQMTPFSGAVVQQLTEVDYKETMIVLSVLEGAAASFAAEQMEESDILKLEQVNNSAKEALEDFDFNKANDLNLLFHRIIHEHCGNTYLIDRIKQTWQRVSQVKPAVGYALVPQRAKKSIQEHDDIIKLFREKAPADIIEKSIREHHQETLEAVLNYLKNLK